LQITCRFWKIQGARNFPEKLASYQQFGSLAADHECVRREFRLSRLPQQERPKVCQIVTLISLLLLAFSALAQSPAPAGVKLNWRSIGNTVIANERAGWSGAPVSGLWFSEDETAVEAQLPGGRTFRRTIGEENWTLAPSAGKRLRELEPLALANLPEPAARVLRVPGKSESYALGRNLYKSIDFGRHWMRIASSDRQSLIGENLIALAVGEANPDYLAAATSEGIWFSSDGGESWLGLNNTLPNIHLQKIIATPFGGRGLLALTADLTLLEWVPGSRDAWRPRGRVDSWTKQLSWTGPEDTGLHFAVRDGVLARTINGAGEATALWEAVEGPWRDAEITGLAVDANSNSLYVATAAGGYWGTGILNSRSAPITWQRLPDPAPGGSWLDIYLDEASNFLYASVQGYGIFFTQAPHRSLAPAFVSSADLRTQVAAPGALLSLLGAKRAEVAAGSLALPVLNATSEDGERTEIQVPFDAPVSGSLSPSAESATALRIPLAPTAPVIFTDSEGSPLLLDAETGSLLDPAEPLRAGQRIQILMSGLGAVTPNWPAGVPAPEDNPPRVLAPVRVWMNGLTLEVLRSELAAGYVGTYLVEVKLPPFVDAGLVPLAVEADGRLSNSIRIAVIN
jgi:uncharacterized protein (TIGR03437 family)